MACRQGGLIGNWKLGFGNLKAAEESKFVLFSMIELINLIGDKKYNAWLKKVGEKVAKDLKTKRLISVILVGDKKIRELNRQYRKKDKVTDVLSFGDWHSPDFLGEIVISLPQIKRQARQYGVSVKEELARMLVHGLLHLRGWDHERSRVEEKRMIKKQESIMKHVTHNT